MYHYFSLKKNSEPDDMDQNLWSSMGVYVVSLAVALGVGLFVLAGIMIAPPQDFPVGTTVHIPEGSSVNDIAEILAKGHVIQKPKFFVQWARSWYRDETFFAGDYHFPRAPLLPNVVHRIATADYGQSRIRIVLQEGMTNSQMGDILADKLSGFNRREFDMLTQDKEGYLFPDTYLFFPSATAEQVIQVLEQQFEEEMAGLSDLLVASGRTRKEIVIMASIIEREAYGSRDSYTISGILWNRIERGMLLQVDAPFVYFLGKGSSSLTREDLRMDHPYNTYVHKGLPPGPIGNPGTLALKAAMRPEKTPYIFYLHDSSGIAHYATTHSGHVQNKKWYLK